MGSIATDLYDGAHQNSSSPLVGRFVTSSSAHQNSSPHLVGRFVTTALASYLQFLLDPFVWIGILILPYLAAYQFYWVGIHHSFALSRSP